MFESGARSATIEERSHAVERAVEVIRTQYDRDLTLVRLGAAALLSPFHFSRVFAEVCGISPGRFLSTVRMAAAKRLLASTELPVTTICYRVGYQSVGTFSTQFCRLVGLPPSKFRIWFRRAADVGLAALLSDPPAGPSACGISGSLILEEGAAPKVAFLASFPSWSAQGAPLDCTCVEAPGSFLLERGWGRAVGVLGCAYPRHMTVAEAILLAPDETAVCRTGRNDLESAPSRPTVLHPPRAVDPPIIFAAPLLRYVECVSHQKAGPC